MRRLAVVLGAVAACGGGSHATGPVVGSPAGTTAPIEAKLPAPWIVGDATSVIAWRPRDFPLWIFDEDQCWLDFVHRVVVAYQVYVPAPTPSSYVVLVGDLPRAPVERCVVATMADEHEKSTSVEHDGDLTRVTSKSSDVYAAWRDGRVVIGRRDDVERALAEPAPPAWFHADDVPTPSSVATTAMAMTGIDRTFGALLGVPTTRWTFALRSPARPWPDPLPDAGDALAEFGRRQEVLAIARKTGVAPPRPPPPPPKEPPAPPRFAGRAELTFATAGDAVRAAATLAAGRFTIALEPHLARDLAALPTVATGATLAITFDQDSWPGVDTATLQTFFGTAR